MSRLLGQVTAKLARDPRTATWWHSAIKLSQLSFTEALLLRIVYIVGLSTVLFYEAIAILLKLSAWVR